MRNIIVLEFISLEGVLQSPGLLILRALPTQWE